VLGLLTYLTARTGSAGPIAPSRFPDPTEPTSTRRDTQIDLAETRRLINNVFVQNRFDVWLTKGAYDGFEVAEL
jgi:hypothetical protein